MRTLEEVKRETLRRICELPGWGPPPRLEGSQLTQALAQLVGEGMIRPRGDGWEATIEAIDTYPFEPEPAPASPRAGRPRAVVLLRGLLEKLPATDLVELLYASEGDYAEGDFAWAIAEQLAILLGD